MKRGTHMKLAAILAACMALSLAGCVLRGKPKTVAAVPVAPKPVESAPPAPPPPPLSIPQTNVELPKAQPLDPEALITVTRSTRRTAGPAAVSNSTPRAETQPASPQAETERPPIQEIVPPAEQKRLQESVQRRKAEIIQILAQTKNSGLTPKQQGEVRSIRSLVELVDDAA